MKLLKAYQHELLSQRDTQMWLIQSQLRATSCTRSGSWINLIRFTQSRLGSISLCEVLPYQWRLQILFSALRKKDKITRFHFSKIVKYFSKIDFDAEKPLNSKIDFSLFRHFLSWNENCQFFSEGLQNFLSNSLT